MSLGWRVRQRPEIRGEQADALLPGRVLQRHGAELGPDHSRHAAQHGVLVRYVVVERHRARLERGREFTHGERLDPVRVDELQGGGIDPASVRGTSLLLVPRGGLFVFFIRGQYQIRTLYGNNLGRRRDADRPASGCDPPFIRMYGCTSIRRMFP